MKYRLLLLALVFCCGAYAQDGNFGNPSAAEIALTECSFDKDADAIILLHEASTSYDDYYQMITRHHIRMKILKENGIDEANISIPFQSYNDFEFVSNIKAVTINTGPDGLQTTYEVDRKSIYKKGKTLYWSEMTFTFPQVKVGSILEYSYTSTCKHYGGLNDWEFQSWLPVVKSKYDLVMAPKAEFSYVVRKSPSLPIDIKKNDFNAGVVFAMQNLPGLRSEPYMNARRDYLQRVEFQLAGYAGYSGKTKYMTSWDEVIKELNNTSEFTGQLNKNLDGVDDLVKLAKQLPPLQRMEAIYNFVRDNMSWNGVPSLYSIDGIKTAWGKKTGTSGDINLILINLLKSADLEVYPMLVSERHHGHVDPNTPFVDQFNKTDAAVIIDGKRYYLDAVNKFGSSRAIPLDILNTTALIVNRRNGGLIEIKDESLAYQDYINVAASVGADGVMDGRTYISAKDYARSTRLGQLKTDRAKYIRSLADEAAGIFIDSFTTVNEQVDSLPLQHTFNFRDSLSISGNYIFLPLNLFSGYKSNPFIADQRLTDINFGCKKQVVVNFIGSVPDGYVIDALPKAVQLMNSDKTILFTRQTFKDETGRKVISRMRIDLSKTFYSADEYGELKEFYKKMFEFLNEPAVLKKQ